MVYLARNAGVSVSGARGGQCVLHMPAISIHFHASWSLLQNQGACAVSGTRGGQCILHRLTVLIHYHASWLILHAMQERVLSLVQEGGNVFFTGNAGTGKTFLLSRILTGMLHWDVQDCALIENAV